MPGPGGAPTPGVSSVPGDAQAAGLLPLRRLSAREYLNTLRDLLNDTADVALGDLPLDQGGDAFTVYPFLVPVDVGKNEADLLRSASERVVQSITSRLSSLLPCSANGTNDATCASQFIDSFGTKAYRRPLDAQEKARLNALYGTARTTLALNFNAAIGLLVEAILQSPGFLYHWEKDPGKVVRDGSVVQLGPYQIANRLSYLLWGSMPDATLFSAAAKNQLSTAEAVEAQARRMLEDARAREAVSNFLSDLFDMDLLALLSKDTTVSPLYQMFDDLKAPMAAEFNAFGPAVILDGSGRFDDLFSSTTSFVNQSLAPLYGVSGVTGTALSKVQFDANQRGGLLTLSGLLANYGAANESSSIRRGRILFTRVLCGVVGHPPPNVPATAPPSAGGTSRQRAQQHATNPCATACHSQFDPLGLAFEHYGGIGNYVTSDNGLPVDSTTEVDLEGNGTRTPVSDGLALSRLIATSPRAQACFATQWLRYATGRLDTTADVASIQAATARFRGASNDIRELIVALSGTRTLRFRTPGTGEVLE